MAKWNSTAPGGLWAGDKLHAYATSRTVAKDKNGLFVQRDGWQWTGDGLNPKDNPDSRFEVVKWG